MATIATPTSAELPEALALLFQHLPEDDRCARLRQAEAQLGQGDWRAEELLAAHDEKGELCGVMVCTALPGASGLCWPPQVRPGDNKEALEDQLVQASLAKLRGGGAKLAQAFLWPEDTFLARPLERNGFHQVTQIEQLRHSLQGLDFPVLPTKLTYQTYADNPDLFAKVLERSYEGTLDCPELNGVQTIDEILAGHRGQGEYRPDCWWLAYLADQPVGVLLLTVRDQDSWEIAYLGVVPEARRQGCGRQLVQLALENSCKNGARQLTLSLDARNVPARRLYEGMGFSLVGWREVYLCFLAS